MPSLEFERTPTPTPIAPRSRSEFVVRSVNTDEERDESIEQREQFLYRDLLVMREECRAVHDDLLQVEKECSEAQAILNDLMKEARNLPIARRLLLPLSTSEFARRVRHARAELGEMKEILAEVKSEQRQVEDRIALLQKHLGQKASLQN